MHMEFDETATSQEKEEIFRQAGEAARKVAADIIYKKAIEGGASMEEAAKRASKAEICL